MVLGINYTTSEGMRGDVGCEGASKKKEQISEIDEECLRGFQLSMGASAEEFDTESAAIEAAADGEYGVPYVVYRPCLQMIRATSMPSNSPSSCAFLIKVPFSCLLLRSFVFLLSPGCFA